MKDYIKPMMNSELFMADEYVAACWYVACNYENANELEKKMLPTNPNNHGKNNYTDGQTHALEQCGTSGNQVIVTDPLNVATGMYEINSKTGVKELVCALYSSTSYDSTIPYSGVNIGDTIYWTTKLGNGTTWYHQGTVNGVDSNHPNRS